MIYLYLVKYVKHFYNTPFLVWNLVDLDHTFSKRRVFSYNNQNIHLRSLILENKYNTPEIPNKKIREVHGIARGSTVRARNVGRDIFASLKNIVGGEISEYTRLQAESREQALQRMEDDAKKMGANAIINVRLTTSMVMQGCSEILAYGTAVTVD